jgi:hypothetical protein
MLSVPEEAFLHGVDEILTQVPTIDHLHGIRGAPTCGLTIGWRTIAADHFNPGMLLEPWHQGRGSPIAEQIDDLTPLQVDQDRAVAMAFAEGPIVDPERPWRGRRDHGRATDQAEQGGRAGRHPEALNNPGAGLATQRERQETHHLGEASGPTSVAIHHAGQPFGEDPT